jgi:hypothetical protein
LAALLYLAAVRSTVRLAAGVLVIPRRNPVLLAEQLTSLDVLSEGAAPGEVTVDFVEAYEGIGVSRLVVGPDTGEGSEPDRFIEAFERDVLRQVAPEA